MTLGRRGREPVQGPAPRREPLAVEVEDLPPQRVQARGPVRPHLGPVLAASAVGVILIAGLGLLGGRALPRPGGTATIRPSAAATHPPDVVPAPRVTPNVACVPIPADVVPGAILQVGARRELGSVEIVGPPGPPPVLPPGDVDVAGPNERIEIRSDLVSMLHTQGDACALAWKIALVDEYHAIMLEVVSNPDASPGYAQQNRFDLSLWPYRARRGGADFRLDAGLSYPDVAVLVRWQVRILPFQAPEPNLAGAGTEIPLIQGCDVELILFGGGHERVNPCFGDVGAFPASPITIKRRAPLVFDFPIGWDFNLAEVVCGQLSGSGFVREPEATCAVTAQADSEVLAIEAPRQTGRWTLKVGGCAVQRLSDAENDLCGSWYATVRVRG